MRVVLLLLQMKESSLQDTLASRYTYKNSGLYLDIQGAGGATAAPDEGEVITGHARFQVHSQAI